MEIKLKAWQLGVLIFSAGGVIILCGIACSLVILGTALLPQFSTGIPQENTQITEVGKEIEIVDPTQIPTVTALPTTIPTATLFPTLTPIPTEPPTAVPLPPTPMLPAIGSCTAFNERETARVINVVDGDTIDVVIGEQNFAVRYIGMNTPERGEVNSQAAINFNSSLVKDQVVTLVKDVSETDSFGRLLRYVFIGNIFVNYELVRQGYATATSYPPDTACDSTFQTGQLEAQAGKVGMWSVVVMPTMPVRLPPTIPVGGGSATCNCSGPDLDCKDFTTHDSAQACYNSCIAAGYGDVFDLDGNDNDGLACESLP